MYDILMAVIGVSASVFTFVFVKDLLKRRAQARVTPGLPLTGASFVAAFLDTLGIGGFATLTSVYKLTKLVDDRVIPGTLNVGFCLPVVAQAFFFKNLVDVQPGTIVPMMLAATLGAVIGAGIVSKMPVDKIRVALGTALAVVAVIVLTDVLKLRPSGGSALGLAGASLVIAVAVNFILGSLMTIGIGLYAPCMALVLVMGMDPRAAFPIMMGSCALLQPWAGIKFIKASAYDPKAAFALTAAGILSVLLAVYIIKTLPTVFLKWVIVFVILYASILMFRSIGKESAAPAAR